MNDLEKRVERLENMVVTLMDKVEELQRTSIRHMEEIELHVPVDQNATKIRECKVVKARVLKIKKEVEECK